MARRGVVTLAPDLPEQVPEEMLNPHVRRQTCVGHLRAAIELKAELKKQEGVIAAEARSRGISFPVIGHALSISKSRAHQRYSGLRWKDSELSCRAPEWSSGQSITSVARHLIHQVGSVTSFEVPSNLRLPQDWIEVLAFLKSAQALRNSMESTTCELVAEMRALGITWPEIADILGDGKPKSTAKRHGDGVSADRLASLRWEREAAAVLICGPLLNYGDDGPEDVTPSDALRYAMDSMKRARDYGVKYVGEVLERVKQGDLDEPVGLKWLEKSAGDRIPQAIWALLAPGVLNEVLQRAQEVDERIEGVHLKYKPFILHTFFLFALSSVYTSEVIEPIMIPKGNVDARLTAAIKGLEVADEAIQTAEHLGIDRIFYSWPPSATGVNSMSTWTDWFT